MIRKSEYPYRCSLAHVSAHMRALPHGWPTPVWMPNCGVSQKKYSLW